MRQAKMCRLNKPLDSSDHAARAFRLTAIRKELLALTGRTEFAVEDMIAIQTSLLHLSPVGLGEINRPAGSYLLPFREVRRKLLRDFDADLVATVTNTRTYRRINIGRR